MGVDQTLAAVILAAGKGTRMKSLLPKVMHCLLGTPLLGHVITVLERAGIPRKQQVIVAGHGRDHVMNYLRHSDNKIVYQHEQLGTGHAVLCTRELFIGFAGQIMIICGDTPLFKTDTLKAFIASHLESQAAVSILSATFNDPTGYGRILRGRSGHLKAIIEEKDADQEIKKIREVNTGTYLVDSSVIFSLLDQVNSDNAQGEYYLTDVVAIALEQGLWVEAFNLASEEESLGVNSRYQLSVAESVLLERIRHGHMDSGVTISMPETVYIEPSVVIEPDAIICSHTVLKGGTRIGMGAVVGPYSYLEEYNCPPGSVIAPYTIKAPKNSQKELCP